MDVHESTDDFTTKLLDAANESSALGQIMSVWIIGKKNLKVTIQEL